MTEIWKPVLEAPDKYEVSNLGNVRSIDRIIIRSTGVKEHRKGQPLKAISLPTGYRLVSIGANNHRLIGNLVLESFVSPRPVGLECCHNNGKNYDDRVDNLRWDTHSNNQLDQIKHGTHANANKIYCPRGHALIEPNLYSTALDLHVRKCKSCNNASAVEKRTGKKSENFQALSDYYYNRIMSDK